MITQYGFGKTASGEAVKRFRLDNGNMTVDITNYGGTILSIRVPDQRGVLADVVLGYDTIDEYERNGGYFGATVGRYGNRIKDGKFMLNGEEYQLACNDGENHLHGGIKGFDKKLWDFRLEGESLVLSTQSPDLEEGYPGKLSLAVKFTLSAANELILEYYVKTDRDTYVNMTNHAYFNLNGHNKGDILRHKIRMNADRFTRVGEGAIPTGELPEVADTPFDFTESHTIGKKLWVGHADLEVCGGIDHNFVLRDFDGTLREAAVLKESYTGRIMTVYTTLPGIQLYIGNMITPVPGKAGSHYGKRAGLCLETQYFPDSPNQPAFPSCLVKAGEDQQSVTVYQFSVTN